MPRRIFLNNWDTYVSQAVFTELRNDDKDPETGEVAEDANLIYGTYITKDSSIKPSGVNKMLKRSKPRLAAKYISDCDLIVYDLHSGNPQDVKLALEAMKKYVNADEDGGGTGEDKVIVLISSLMAWDSTPRKLEVLIEPGTEPEEVKKDQPVVKVDEDGNESDKGSQAASEEQQEALPAVEEDQKSVAEGSQIEENTSPKQEFSEVETVDPIKKRIKRKYLNHAFAEADYKDRRASEEYRAIKEVEDLVLEAQRPGIRTYVISAGVLYGKGEAIFNSHFKKAWLQNPERLPICGEGKNYVPTVHVTDLARMVKKIFETKPERQYIFGIDNTQTPRQRRLVQAISEGIGTGLVENVDIPPKFDLVHPSKTPLQLDLDWRKFLLMNIKCKPSTLFIQGGEVELDEEGNEVVPEAGEDDFKWLCKNGLAANIQLVKEEFCQERNLKPFKICIIGKPFTGKSFYAKQLAEHYNVPHIHALQVLEDVENFDKAKREEYEFKVKEKKRLAKIGVQRIKEAISADELFLKEKKLRQQKRRRNARKIKDGENYQDSADEDSKRRKKKVVKAEVEEKESGSDNEDQYKPTPAKAVESDDDKDIPNDVMAAYRKKLQQSIQEDADTDEEYTPLEIRTKVHAYKAEHKNTISSGLMSEAFRWRLSQTDCQNRGYVLDGYPKSYATSQEVFIVTPQRPEKAKPTLNEDGEVVEEEAIPDEEAEEMAKKYAPQFQKHIYPNSVIYLRGEDEAILKRETKKGSDGAAVDMLRGRLEKYSQDNDLNLFRSANNNDKLGHSNCPPLKYPITRFFQENKTEVFGLHHDGEKFEMFEGMRVYIERNGRPFNYLNSVRHLNRKREENLEQEESLDKQTKAEGAEESAKGTQKVKDSLVGLADGRIPNLKSHMKELETMEQLNMRQFLMKAIIPVLTEGMIETWRTNPVDPVDFLGDYVFKRSNECHKKATV